MKKNSQAKVVLITCEPMMINDTTYKFAVIINAAIDTNTYLSYADYGSCLEDVSIFIHNVVQRVQPVKVPVYILAV